MMPTRATTPRRDADDDDAMATRAADATPPTTRATTTTKNRRIDRRVATRVREKIALYDGADDAAKRGERDASDGESSASRAPTSARAARARPGGRADEGVRRVRVVWTTPRRGDAHGRRAVREAVQRGDI